MLKCKKILCRPKPLFYVSYTMEPFDVWLGLLLDFNSLPQLDAAVDIRSRSHTLTFESKFCSKSLILPVFRIP